jgi:serine-type D-Ala-D-Ala carboxypeptidase (penicillin-binding protein 5/6)
MANIRKKNVLILILIITSIISSSGYAEAKEPYVSARCAIALDAKTKVPLYEKDSGMLVPIASTTKIITSLVAIKYGNLEKKIEISSRSAGIKGSTVGYKKGELITLKELLFGLMLRSGNDAAIAIAEGISGNVEEFVKLMNEYSAEIGLTNSHFETPHGLDRDYHYSTAYDLAVATAKAKECELFNAIVASKDVDGKSMNFTRSYHNINKILWQIPEANGVKTGYTGKAGKCLVTSVNIKGNDVIIVILNCNERWRETKKIYDYIITNYEYKKFSSKGDVEAEIPLKRSNLVLVSGEDVVLPVDKNLIYDKIVVVPKNINRNINAGDSVGIIKILRDGNEIYSKNLCANNSIRFRKDILKFLFN